MEGTPSWISQTDSCTWCGKDEVMELYHVRLVEVPVERVEAWYVCKNEDCGHAKRRGTPHLYGLSLTGGYVKAYKDILIKKEDGTAPEVREDLAAPAEVKVG